MGWIFSSILIIGLLIGLSWGAEYLGIIKFGFFEPKKENIRREVFENTKSYVQGVAQDLGKYYQEYQEGDLEKQEAIKNVIRMRFAEFDESKLQNDRLRVFLVNMRGY